MYPQTSGLNDDEILEVHAGKLQPGAFAIGLKLSTPCNVAVIWLFHNSQITYFYRFTDF